MPDQNVKEALDRIIKDEGKLRSLARQLADDKYVKRQKLRPKPNQVRVFFECFRRGIEYAAAKYGTGAMPLNLSFVPDYFDEHGKKHTMVIGYIGDLDIVVLSHQFIAARCALLGNGEYYLDSHLPGGKVTAEDRTTLQAIEECYHRYQKVSLGYSQSESTTDALHPHELEIQPVWERAISDLGIQVLPAPRVDPNTLR